MELINVFLLSVLLLTFENTVRPKKIDFHVHVCGFEPKCSGNKIDLERKKSSCCLSCSCTNICLERNTCCWDGPRPNQASMIKKQQCLPALYKPRGISEDVSVDSYYTRSFCPDTYTNLSVKNRCETTAPESFDEISFVSSEDGKIVYKNKYCGLCNGENKTRSWEMTILLNKKCGNVQTIPTESIELFMQFTILHCMMAFEKPSGIDVRSVLCFDKTKVISECNVTGKWDLYNSELEKLCLNDSTPVYVERPNEFAYSNPYCYLCNQNKKKAQCYNNFDQRFTSTPYIALIDVDKWKLETGMLSDTYRELCRNDEIMDTFFGLCRRLYCPKYTLPVHGKCITVFDFGQCTILLLSPILDSYVNQYAAVKEIFDSDITKIRLQELLGLDKCLACSTNVYTKKSNETGIYIGLCFQATIECQNEYLWTRLFEVKAKSYIYINLKRNGKIGTYQMFIMNENFSSSKYVLLHQKPRLNSGQCRPDAGANLSLCSKVELSKDEYEKVMRTHVNAEKLIFTSNEEEKNETMFVCSNNYIITSQSMAYKTNVSDKLEMIAFLLCLKYALV